MATASSAGKPGTNWVQVGPRERKKIGPIVRYYMKKAHPFTACVRDNTKRFGPERAKRVCAVVKDMGERRTTWRKGGGKKVKMAVMEAAAAGADVDELIAADVEATWDELWVPALTEAGVTVDELADWSEMAQAAGVLESVDLDEEGDYSRIVEAARKATPMSHTKRRSGESLHDWGVRLKRGDKALRDAADAKTRGGKNAAFEKQHPRTRSGEWRVKLGSGETITVKRGKDGNLVGTGSGQSIRAFQKKHGLTVDGIIGRQTATAILGDAKKARGTKVGTLSAEQAASLTKHKATRKRGRRSRQAADSSSLSDVTFKPSELVTASAAVADE